MKKYLALIAFCFCFNAAYGQEYYSRFSPSADVTLEQAVRLGIENNVQLLSAEQSIIIAQQRIKEANYMRLPQFDLLATATAYDLDYATVLPPSMGLRVLTPQSGKSESFYGAGVTAVQYLYSGGRISGAVKMSKAQLKEEQSRYDTVRNKVALEVKTAFYNLLYAQKNAELAKDGYEKAKIYSSRAKGGSWESVSVSAAAERFRIEHNKAQHGVKQAKLKMLEAINKELNSEIQIKGDFAPYFYEAELSKLNLWAMQFRSELRTALYEVEMYNISSSVSQTQKYPDIILGASYEQVGEDSLEDTNKQVSLAMRLPLPYNLFSQPKQKKAQQKQSSLRRTDIEDSIRAQVAHCYDSFSFWQDEVKQREESLEVLSKALAAGEKASKQYGLQSLQALEDYQQARASYLEAVKENLCAKAHLEWAIGQDI